MEEKGTRVAGEITLVIPMYNESMVAPGVLASFVQLARGVEQIKEIIVVDDGSTDGSGDRCTGIAGITVIRHQQNLGYGASIKNAVRAAQTEWILMCDADGQHSVEHVMQIIRSNDGADMIVGERRGWKGPLIRQPGKWLLGKISEYLVSAKIPDLNSGLRLIRKRQFMQYAHLYPNGFSLTTTITLAFLKAGLRVRYVPIEIVPRKGRSTVNMFDAVRMFMLIIRVITLFSPLRIMLPFAVLFGVLTFWSFGYDMYMRNLTDTTVFLALSSTLFFFFGILLDQVAAIRREIHS